MDKRHAIITSRRYFISFCDILLMQSGPQPQLGPHSNTTSLALTNLSRAVHAEITFKTKSTETQIEVRDK